MFVILSEITLIIPNIDNIKVGYDKMQRIWPKNFNLDRPAKIDDISIKICTLAELIVYAVDMVFFKHLPWVCCR